MLSSPYVAGDKDTETDAEKVFVIENIAANSPVARIEHSPRTNPCKLIENYLYL